MQVTYQVVELAADQNAAVAETPFDVSAFVDSETAANIQSKCGAAANPTACADGLISSELGDRSDQQASATPPPTNAGAGSASSGVHMNVVLSRLNSTVRSLATTVAYCGPDAMQLVQNRGPCRPACSKPAA